MNYYITMKAPVNAGAFGMLLLYHPAFPYVQYYRWKTLDIFAIHIAIMPFSWQNEIQKNSIQQQNEKEDGT